MPPKAPILAMRASHCTACAWYKTQSGELMYDNFCFVTDELDHNEFAAYHFKQKLISLLREKVPNLQTIHFWSDGCAAQFKSKYCLKLLMEYPADLEITWSYFESHHGKGPVDGIGGRLKNQVYKTVKAGHIVINGAEQFATHANSIITGIQTSFTSKSEIQILELDHVYEVPGTRKIYYVRRLGHTLSFYNNSKFQSLTLQTKQKFQTMMSTLFHEALETTRLPGN